MLNKFEIRYNLLKPKPGSLLISEPLLPDLYFNRSVVLIIDHTEKEGTVGVILNKSLDATFNQIINMPPVFNTDIFFGGPVATKNIYFLHTLGQKINNSLEIKHGLFWGGDSEQVTELIKLNIVNKENIRFFVGYAGWQPKQLNKEFMLNNWAVVDAETSELWETPSQKLWETMVDKLGNNYNFWKKMPLNPNFN